jgi:hypothetical protein
MGIVVAIGFATIWQMPTAQSNPTTRSRTRTIEQSQLSPTPCKFNKPVRLKTTRTYDIFGGSEFDTLVCGYLFTQPEENFDTRITVAYLRIINAPDRRFLRSMKREIDRGNSVNFVRDKAYHFNLGCLKNGKIQGIKYDRRYPYLTDRVEQSILRSTPQQPVRLILSFGKHIGSGCECCNLAHRIRLYE